MCDKRANGSKRSASVRMEEAVGAEREAITRNPRKNVWRLAQQIGVSVIAEWKSVVTTNNFFRTNRCGTFTFLRTSLHTLPGFFFELSTILSLHSNTRTIRRITAINNKHFLIRHIPRYLVTQFSVANGKEQISQACRTICKSFIKLRSVTKVLNY
jgi:hypothetical protein